MTTPTETTQQTGLPWPEIEYDNDTGPCDEGFWEWWEIPGVAKFNLEQDAIIARTAVNERPDLLARIKRLEEAAYHLKLARDAWNFDQTEANFKILGDALDRVVALTE